ncbi:MAG: stage V sporulation protein S [Erysipelotrichaceae bacterium]|nr:stage V sporulation protein S [Erysipelotrichaceae bacterium]
MIELIKVSKNSNVNAVAGSIANIMREQERLYIQVVGAGSLNQAIKALAIARGYLTPSGIDIYMYPSFKEVTIEKTVKTAIRIVVEKKVMK